MVGPRGELLSAAFAVSGVLVVGSGMALWQSDHQPRVRIIAALVVVAGAALSLVAFPPDAPGTSDAPSWQDRIHNVAYPVIPVAGLIGMAVALGGDRTRRRWRRMAGLSAATLVVALPGFALTFTDDLPQLGRYFLFGGLLAWVEGLALTGLPVGGARED